MKLLVPILIIALIVLGALAFWKFGMGSNNPARQLTSQTTTPSVSKVPITGNPDDINATINQAAQSEGNAVSTQDESGVANQNNVNVTATGDTVDENSF